jgi:hypothetical protein
MMSRKKIDTSRMAKRSSPWVAGWGEHQVAAELSALGWIVCKPERDEGIDLVAFRMDRGRFEHAFLQVKTARFTTRSGYSINIRKSKVYPERRFFFVFALDDRAKGRRFLLMSSEAWESTMGKSLHSKSWRSKGAYKFSFRQNLGRWAKFEETWNSLD